MAKTVGITAGKKNILLPNGVAYDGVKAGIVLTNAQTAAIKPALIPATVTTPSANIAGSEVQKTATINSGQTNVQLPNGYAYSGGDVVVLTAEQAALVPASAVGANPKPIATLA